MKRWRASWVWLLFAFLGAGALGQTIAPAGAWATPFASPTPDPNTLNQPFVTFQHTNPLQSLFRFDSGVPIFWTILVLLLLLGLVSLYIHSSHSRH